jgi:hypothetical protein
MPTVLRFVDQSMRTSVARTTATVRLSNFRLQAEEGIAIWWDSSAVPPMTRLVRKAKVTLALFVNLRSLSLAGR